MFGFLAKIVIVALLVAGVGGYFVYKKGGELPKLPTDLSQLSIPVDTRILGLFKQNLSSGNLGQQLSSALDSLVTHPDRNSPVVLGIKATNESVELITDALMSLPNDKLEQVKQALCASPSAQ